MSYSLGKFCIYWGSEKQDITAMVHGRKPLVLRERKKRTIRFSVFEVEASGQGVDPSLIVPFNLSYDGG